MLNQITPLVLTLNEGTNIGRTLERLRWARDIVVVDSFSDDDTVEIASSYPQVRVFQRQFDSFANQCNLGLEHTGIRTDWVLSLDADYILTEELINELKTVQPDATVSGFRARFIYCINGRRLRSGVYPPVTVLFRRSKATYQEDGHAHRVSVDGPVWDLQAPILHDDRKPLKRWFQSQLAYTKLEAEKILSADPATLLWTDRLRRLRVVAPLAMLFYCLFLRGGIFDGRAGFFYAFQRMLAEMMLSLYLLDHDLQKKLGSRIPDRRSQGFGKPEVDSNDLTDERQSEALVAKRQV